MANEIFIDGDANAIQLRVQGHSPQTNPLQTWEDSSGTILAQLDETGLFQGQDVQVGDDDATSDALIEAHNLDDPAKPSQGLHTAGIVSGTLDDIVRWVVQELTLRGSGGISAPHSALQAQLTNENTGPMSAGADLRAGDFEFSNSGGSSGDPVPEVAALHAAITNQVGGYLGTAYGLRVRVTDDGSSTKIYAIHTEDGVVHLDSELELPVVASAPTTNPDTDFIKLYVMLDNGTPQLYGRDASGTLHLLSGSGGSTNWASPGVIGSTTPNDATFDDLRVEGSHYMVKEADFTYQQGSVYSNTNWHSHRVAHRRARGTESTPAAVQDYDSLGALSYYGYDGTAMETAGFVFVEASENWDADSRGTRVAFRFNGNGGAVNWPAAGLIIEGQSVDVPGTLSKGSGTFHIDHPVDPLNQDLLHGFVEGPRFDLIYRGTAQLVAGTARASIDAASNLSPGTFAALTQHPQVWVHNVSGWDLVRGRIEDGEVVIESQNRESTAMVDWLVVAERADGFIRSLAMTDADGHLIPEQAKPEPTGRETRPMGDPSATEDYEVAAVDLLGKRGYPRHLDALGLDITLPTRPVKAGRSDTPA